MYPAASPSGALHFQLSSFSYCWFPGLTAVFPAFPSGALTSCCVPFLLLISLSYSWVPCICTKGSCSFSCVLCFYGWFPCLSAEFPVLQLCSLHFPLGPWLSAMLCSFFLLISVSYSSVPGIYIWCPALSTVFLSYCHCLNVVLSASPSGALTSCCVPFLFADFPVLQLCSLRLPLGPWLLAVFLFLLLISLSYSCVLCTFTWGPDFHCLYV